MVAAGPPNDSVKSAGYNWTEKETLQAKQLEKEVIVVECSNPPTNRWYQQILSKG